jgi:hypothetical protein
MAFPHMNYGLFGFFRRNYGNRFWPAGTIGNADLTLKSISRDPLVAGFATDTKSTAKGAYIRAFCYS